MAARPKFFICDLLMKARTALITALALFILPGCYEPSLYPYHTPDAVVPAPKEIPGEWQPLVVMGEKKDEKYPSWFFRSDVITTFDQNHRPGLLKTGYFKVGDQFYCTITIGDHEDLRTNEFSQWYTWAVCHCMKVIFENEQMIFRPMALQGCSLKTMDKTGLLQGTLLPGEGGQKDKLMFFTNPSENWMKFIQLYDKDIFCEKYEFRFKRVVATPVISSPAKP